MKFQLTLILFFTVVIINNTYCQNLDSVPAPKSLPANTYNLKCDDWHEKTLSFCDPSDTLKDAEAKKIAHNKEYPDHKKVYIEFGYCEPYTEDTEK